MRGFVCVIAALVASIGASTALADPPPVEAYGRLPAALDASLSPDGSKVALASFDNGRPHVRVIEVDRHALVFDGVLEGQSRLRSVSWLDDTHLAFRINWTWSPGLILPENVSFRGFPGHVDYFRTGVVDITNGHVQFLTTSPDLPWMDQGSDLVGPIAGDEGHARMIGTGSDIEHPFPHLFRVDLRTGGVQSLPGGGANRQTRRLFLNAQGAIVLRTDVDDHNNHWSAFSYDGEAARLLREGDSPTGLPPTFSGLFADGRVAMLDENAGGFVVLDSLDPVSGTPSVLFEQVGYDMDGAIVDPRTRQVVGVEWIETEIEQHFFDPGLQHLYDSIRAGFPAGSPIVVDWSEDRHRALVYAERGLDGGAYYVFSAQTGALVLVSALYPELQRTDNGERQALTYRARDGVRIPAYLTLPPGAGDAHRNLPLVLLVHGGPASRDTLAFDWRATFLASRGYAVLQPNFRGSGGLGRDWERAGWGQWGGLMQTDLEDGVNALAHAGIIVASRVCIVGASYGGYAALAGAAFTPDRYRCAVSVAGVSDIDVMINQDIAEAGRESSSADYWRLSIGSNAADRRAHSPANFADRVRIPVLLIHGTNDTVVPISQSRLMQRRLLDAGKQVRFVELAGDDHYLSQPETRIQMLRELEAFLAENLQAH